MIDVTKCELEDYFRDNDNECTVYYFVYPKELGDAFACRIDEEIADPIVCYCISLTKWDYGGYAFCMSPTVQYGDSLSDVCWFDLCHGIDYDGETITALLDKANK